MSGAVLTASTVGGRTSATGGTGGGACGGPAPSKRLKVGRGADNNTGGGAGGVSVTAARALAFGMELRMTYSAKGNATLLGWYGFCIPNNVEPDAEPPDLDSIFLLLQAVAPHRRDYGNGRCDWPRLKGTKCFVRSFVAAPLYALTGTTMLRLARMGRGGLR